MKIKNRDDAIEALVDRIIDGMDMDTLVTFAKEQLGDHYSSYSDADLLEHMDLFAPDLAVDHAEELL